MFVVDTNVLLYAANADDPAHEVCRAALERWRNQSSPWCLTWGICFEFLRAITHRRGLPSPWQASKAWEFISTLLASPRLEMLVPTARYADIVGEIMREMPSLTGNDMHDMAIAALMRDHGLRTIYTRDTGFHRFRWLEVIDPITAGRGGLHEP
jgi:uncharacterized protein